MFNLVSSKYFNVVSRPTMIYKTVLVDDECGYTVFPKYLEMKIKLCRNFFSSTQISCVSPIQRKLNLFDNLSFNSSLKVEEINQSVRLYQHVSGKIML